MRKCCGVSGSTISKRGPWERTSLLDCPALAISRSATKPITPHDAHHLAAELVVDDRPPWDKGELVGLSTTAPLPLDSCTVPVGRVVFLRPGA